MTDITIVGSAPEIDEIKRVVQLYVEGFQDGIEKLEEAFHRDAWIFALDQAGEVASVLLGFDNSENLRDSWVDVIALLKVGGNWKITNKTAAHSSRAAWAQP